MNNCKLNIDLSMFRYAHNILEEEIILLHEQLAKLSQAIHELDSCWEPQAEIGLKDEFSPVFFDLNSLADRMINLSECMDFALKMYNNCENAVLESVKAV